MSNISSVGSRVVGRVEAVPGKDAARDGAATGSVDAAGPRRGEDRVEVSELSRLISKLNELPPIRRELVDKVRAEIAAGTYETPDRLDLALDALSDDLSGVL